jgi:DNA-binding transcriptional MerR regulator
MTEPQLMLGPAATAIESAAARAATGPRRMLIGKLARLSGRSVYTIRWYESQRLIPGVRRDAQGRRTYVDQHVEWLELLERLRLSGMSIRALREYTALVKRGVDPEILGQRQDLLRAHRAQVEKSLADLKAALELLDAKIAFYERWRQTGEKPEPLKRLRS